MRSLANAAVLAALSMTSSVQALPGDLMDVPDLWTPCGTTNAKKPTRSKSTHKQNARKTRKARK